MFLVGCGDVASTPDARVTMDAPAMTPDTAAGRCDPNKPFGDIKPVPGVNTTSFDENPSLSPDELTIYFASNRKNGGADGNIYVATRANRDDAFGAAAEVTAVNTGADERGPSISSDGLSLYFHSSQTNGYDLYVSTRANTAAAFGAPVTLAALNTADIEESPNITSNGKTLYFDRSSGTTSSLWRSTLGATGFGAPSMVTELDTAAAFTSAVRADDLKIYFASDRNATQGSNDIWAASRASTSDPFGAPTNVTEINSANDDRPGWISPDDCRLYFWSARPGGTGNYDLWQATRPQ
jgi:Tol biopolymer transport system component